MLGARPAAGGAGRPAAAAAAGPRPRPPRLPEGGAAKLARPPAPRPPPPAPSPVPPAERASPLARQQRAGAAPAPAGAPAALRWRRAVPHSEEREKEAGGGSAADGGGDDAPSTSGRSADADDWWRRRAGSARAVVTLSGGASDSGASALLRRLRRRGMVLLACAGAARAQRALCSVAAANAALGRQAPGRSSGGSTHMEIIERGAGGAQLRCGLYVSLVAAEAAGAAPSLAAGTPPPPPPPPPPRDDLRVGQLTDPLAAGNLLGELLAARRVALLRVAAGRPAAAAALAAVLHAQAGLRLRWHDGVRLLVTPRPEAPRGAGGAGGGLALTIAVADGEGDAAGGGGRPRPAAQAAAATASQRRHAHAQARFGPLRAAPAGAGGAADGGATADSGAVLAACRELGCSASARGIAALMRRGAIGCDGPEVAARVRSLPAAGLDPRRLLQRAPELLHLPAPELARAAAAAAAAAPAGPGGEAWAPDTTAALIALAPLLLEGEAPLEELLAAAAGWSTALRAGLGCAPPAALLRHLLATADASDAGAPAAVCQRLARLAEAFGEQGALRLAAAAPATVLEAEPAALAARAEALRAALGMAAAPPLQWLALLCDAPELLGLEAPEAGRRLRALARYNPYQTRGNLLELCRRVPGLLTGEMRPLQEALFALYRLAAQRAAWRRQFQALTPPLVAAFLARPAAPLERLAYLVEADEPAAYTLRTLIKTGDAGFAREFAGFEAWRRRRRQRRRRLAPQPAADEEEAGASGEE